jgi:hypothetical protein
MGCIIKPPNGVLNWVNGACIRSDGTPYDIPIRQEKVIFASPGFLSHPYLDGKITMNLFNSPRALSVLGRRPCLRESVYPRHHLTSG